MKPRALNPILNVSNFEQSIEWFKKLGWEQGWRWGDPPRFGAVWAGHCEIFLCQDGQGGRGRGPHAQTFGPPTDHPWNVREMHVRHPGGHVFRISKSLEEAPS